MAAGYSRGQGDEVREDGWTWQRPSLCAEPNGKRSAQARSWKPGRRRQPSGARERWKPDRGETPQAARCEARQRDRPSPRWPGTPRLQSRISNRVRTSARKAPRICYECGLVDPAQPGRRCSGAPSLRGRDSPQGFPLEASAARSAAGVTASAPGAARRKVRRSRRNDAPKAARRDQLAAGAVIDCNCPITPGSTNTQACLSVIGTLNICANNVRRR